MKIAVVVDSFPITSETFIVDQIRGLIESGNRVDIFAFRKLISQIVHPDIIKFNLLKKVFYFDIPEKRIQRLTKLLATTFFYIIFHSKELHTFINFKKFKTKYEILNNYFILRYFIGKKYDIILCHFGVNGKKLVFLKKFVDSKFICFFHGYDLGIRYSSGYYSDLFNACDLCLPVSEYFRKKLIDLGCPCHKVRVHYLGVDTKRFHYLNRDFNFKKKIKIFTVSRLVEKKGIKYSILAVSNIIKKYNNVEYTITGDGDQKKYLESLVKALSLEQIVKLTGNLRQEEVMKYLYSCDVFILSSITSKNGDQEGIPTVLKEAMATGMVVLSTYHAGIPELINDGRNGFLVKEKDDKELAEKLEYIIKHPVLCRKIAISARENIERNFDINIDIDNLTKRLKEMYKII